MDNYSRTITEKIIEIKSIMSDIEKTGNMDLSGLGLKSKADKNYLLTVQDKYDFEFPKDYFIFITEVADGGLEMNSLDKALNILVVQKPFLGIEHYLKTAFDQNAISDKKELIDEYRNEFTKFFGTNNLESINPIDIFKASQELDLNPFIPRIMVYNEVYQKDLEILDLEDIYIEANRADIAGYIDLFDHGCGHISALIVKGEQFGQMIEIGNDGQLKNHNQTFDEYMEGHLDKIRLMLEKYNSGQQQA